MKYQITNGESMRKISAIVLVLCLLLCGCGQAENTQTQPAEEAVVVGVSLPGSLGTDWAERGNALTQALEALGYTVEITYAGDDHQLQQEQVEKLLLQDVDCLVVTAMDALLLPQTLSLAKEKGIPVVSYQRRLFDTDSVSWHIAYDAVSAGKAVGNHIAGEKQLATAAEEKRQYSVEFMMGAPEDYTAYLLYQGVMSVLQPYLDNGVLTTASGRVAFEDTCIQNWSSADALRYYWDNISKKYENGPDILCTTGDDLAKGACEGLTISGCPADKWPLVTGIGGNQAALDRLAAGQQSLSLKEDNALLAEKCALGVQALLAGKSPQTNGTYYNGMTDVPVWLETMTLAGA